MLNRYCWFKFCWFLIFFTLISVVVAVLCTFNLQACFIFCCTKWGDGQMSPSLRVPALRPPGTSCSCRTGSGPLGPPMLCLTFSNLSLVL